MKKLLVLFAMASLIFTGCKKDEEKEEAKKVDKSVDVIEDATDEAIASNLFDDAYQQSDKAASYEDDSIYKVQKVLSRPFDCNGINIENIAFNASDTTLSFTINYGLSAITCNDGKSRSGKINVSVKGRYKHDKSVRTITFDNYYVNGHKIEGTKSVTTNNSNNGNITFTVKVENGVITKTTGKKIYWTANITREWMEGDSTLLVFTDDVYKLTGTSSGTSSNGRTFTRTITKPLIIDLKCSHTQEGIIEMISDSRTFSIDYGTHTAGQCDNNASIIYNGISYPIELK